MSPNGDDDYLRVSVARETDRYPWGQGFESPWRIIFFHIPTLRHDTYFLNGKSQQNQTCVATTGFPSSVYTTVLFEENAYDFFFGGGGEVGGANMVYYGRYANCELHLNVLNYNTVWLTEKYRKIHQSEARAAAKHTFPRFARLLRVWLVPVCCFSALHISL